MSRSLFRLSLPALVLGVSACGEYTLYDATIQTLLVDEAGEPIRERTYTLCPEFVFEDGEVEADSCGDGFTDRRGVGHVGAWLQTLGTVTEMRATVEVEGVQAEGGVTSFETLPGDPALDVQVGSEFSVPREILPTMVTRFDLTGIVTGGREEHIPNATGTLYIDVELPDGQGSFHGSAPLTTDEVAIYSTQVELVSNYRFPLLLDAITATVDIDGFRGPGNLESLRSDGDDPRIVTGWGTF